MQTIWDSVAVIYNSIPEFLPKKVVHVQIPVEVERVIANDMAASYPRTFIRLAGVSGAMAVALAAYGAHGMKTDRPN